MATLLKCGGLFLHVPKTGGNWVSDVLEAQGLVYAHVGGKHAGLAQLAPLIRLLDTPRRYDKPNRPLVPFCFVRHPLAWYQSWFRMNAARGWPHWATDAEVWNPSVMLNGLSGTTFEDFLARVLAERPGFLSALYGFYTKDAHFVGRQEQAADDLLTVLGHLQLTVDAGRLTRHPRANVSDGIDTTLSGDLQAELERVEAEAYARYGYATSTRHVAAAPTLHAVVPLLPPFTQDAGYGWRAERLHHLTHLADETAHPARSPMVVTEDGRPLRLGHAGHDEIRQAGAGRYSHWRDIVLFSTSDNTNPNENRRRYALHWMAAGGANRTDLTWSLPATA